MRDSFHLDAQMWADHHSGLKELRDLREVRALTQTLMLLNQQKFPQAVGLICQRPREVQVAKKLDGAWEHAALLSPLPTSQASTTALPLGALAF